MEETIFSLEEINALSFLGINHTNLQLLQTLYPRLTISTRGSKLKVVGPKKDTEQFIKLAESLVAYTKEHESISEDVIRRLAQGFLAVGDHSPSHILFGAGGMPIVARNKTQQQFLKDFEENDLIMAIGPAGSGKTYMAIALAVRSFKNKEVKRIILSRPAVEAGENLGFLPGDMKDKIDPYLQPLYDALLDMFPAAKLKELLDSNTIQIAPLAYMRGRTLNDAIVILDEAQNTTEKQLKMFLTRMGRGAKFMITGDITQIDLPRHQQSGLVQATKILSRIKGVSYIQFQREDIVRHRLVRDIVQAYEKDEE